MKPIPEETLQAIRTMYETEKNKAKLARVFSVSISTVYKALGKQDPETQREERSERMGRIAGSMAQRIEELVNGLETPENATYMQKATVVGILTDKLEKLDKRLAESKQEEVLASLPMPETVEALAGALRNDIRSIAFVLQLNPAADKLVREVRQIEAELDRKLVPVEAEIESIDDIDAGHV